MSAKKIDPLCAVCNPGKASPGEYCDEHREALHKLEHHYESLVRLRRTVRGKDHETYEILLQGECEPCGRVLVSESVPDNLVMTLILDHDVNLESPLPEYQELGIQRTWGDYLRDKIEEEIVQCWYGNARACIDVFHSNIESRQHWDIEAHGDESEDGDYGPDPHGSPGGGRHSVH